MRTVAIDDFLENVPGREIYALRVAWRHGQGGRATAALARLNAGNPERLGVAHECWDADGLRTFYEDTSAANDAFNPNAGDEADCVSLAREEAGEPETDAADLDEELTEVLDEAGATDVTEDEAEAGGDLPA